MLKAQLMICPPWELDTLNFDFFYSCSPKLLSIWNEITTIETDPCQYSWNCKKPKEKSQRTAYILKPCYSYRALVSRFIANLFVLNRFIHLIKSKFSIIIKSFGRWCPKTWESLPRCVLCCASEVGKLEIFDNHQTSQTENYFNGILTAYRVVFSK